MKKVKKNKNKYSNPTLTTMKDNSGKIILALLAGASAGIVAGLLMAPDSGTVSRDNLKKYAGKLSKDVEKAVQDNLGKLNGLNTGSILSSLGLAKGENGADAQGGSAAGSASGAGRGRSAGVGNATNAGPEVGEDA